MFMEVNIEKERVSLTFWKLANSIVVLFIYRVFYDIAMRDN